MCFSELVDVGKWARGLEDCSLWSRPLVDHSQLSIAAVKHVMCVVLLRWLGQ